MKRVISTCLALSMTLLCTFALSGSAMAQQAEDAYTIDIPYEFPIQTGTPEWAELNTHRQKRIVSQVPEDILHAMTTEALLETVLNYPLLADIYAYNSTEMGIETVSEQFNGLKELLNRSDFASVALAQMETRSKTLNYNTMSVSDDEDLDFLFESMVLSELISSSTTLAQDYTIGYKLTPMGSSVEVRYPMSDINFIQKKIINDQYDEQYPDATRLDGATRVYNCHNYAWDESAPQEGWMPDPSAYMTDGSYRELDGETLKPGDILYSSEADHSAIIYSISGNIYDPITVTSKWGTAGLYRHSLYDCPYEDVSYSQWR